MKLFVRFTLLLVFAIAVNPLAARDQAPAAPAGRELPKPNYDLASAGRPPRSASTSSRRR